jgi:hypothetical protein
MKYSMPKDPNIINLSVKKALEKNLSGLEINGKSSLKKLVNNINFDDLREMDLIKDNIISEDTRFLLLVSEKSMFGFLIDIIKKEIIQMNKFSINQEDSKKVEYVTYIGIPFKEIK